MVDDGIAEDMERRQAGIGELFSAVRERTERYGSYGVGPMFWWTIGQVVDPADVVHFLWAPDLSHDDEMSRAGNVVLITERALVHVEYGGVNGSAHEIRFDRPHAETVDIRVRPRGDVRRLHWELHDTMSAERVGRRNAPITIGGDGWSITLDIEYDRSGDPFEQFQKLQGALGLAAPAKLRRC